MKVKCFERKVLKRKQTENFVILVILTQTITQFAVYAFYQAISSEVLYNKLIVSPKAIFLAFRPTFIEPDAQNFDLFFVCAFLSCLPPHVFRQIAQKVLKIECEVSLVGGSAIEGTGFPE